MNKKEKLAYPRQPMDAMIFLLAVYSHGMPVGIINTKGITSDCRQANPLIDNIEAEYLLADRAYDTDEIIEKARSSGMVAVIYSRMNIKIKR